MLVPAWIVGSWFSLWWPATIVFMCAIAALVSANVFLLAYETSGRARDRRRGRGCHSHSAARWSRSPSSSSPSSRPVCLSSMPSAVSHSAGSRIHASAWDHWSRNRLHPLAFMALSWSSAVPLLILASITLVAQPELVASRNAPVITPFAWLAAPVAATVAPAGRLLLVPVRQAVPRSERPRAWRQEPVSLSVDGAGRAGRDRHQCLRAAVRPSNGFAAFCTGVCACGRWDHRHVAVAASRGSAPARSAGAREPCRTSGSSRRSSCGAACGILRRDSSPRSFLSWRCRSRSPCASAVELYALLYAAARRSRPADHLRAAGRCAAVLADDAALRAGWPKDSTFRFRWTCAPSCRPSAELEDLQRPASSAWILVISLALVFLGWLFTGGRLQRATGAGLAVWHRRDRRWLVRDERGSAAARDHCWSSDSGGISRVAPDEPRGIAYLDDAVYVATYRGESVRVVDIRDGRAARHRCPANARRIFKWVQTICCTF